MPSFNIQRFIKLTEIHKKDGNLLVNLDDKNLQKKISQLCVTIL